MLTPRDLKKPSNVSGYKYVMVDAGDRVTGHGGSTPGYQANWAAGDGTTAKGPRRKTALEAAQDYCDLVNTGAISAPSIPRYPDVSIDMGNTTRHAPKLDPVKVVRPKHRGKHDVYDVLFLNALGGLVCRKVGITARGHARYADVCKTLGMSIKPFAPAVTHPSEEAAKLAESKLIASVASSPNWKPVGKEAFVPATLAAWGMIAAALEETEAKAA